MNIYIYTGYIGLLSIQKVDTSGHLWILVFHLHILFNDLNPPESDNLFANLGNSMMTQVEKVD